jgi:hypothetical protein
MMMRQKTDRLFWMILIVLIFCFLDSTLSAQNVIPDSLITERIQYIKNTLQHDKANTKSWWYGWLGTYGAATIGQGLVYFATNDKGTRQDMALGAATTLLGATGQFISPLIPRNQPKQLDSISATTGIERLNKLTVAEKVFEECALREKLARSWKNHAICSAVNLSGGLITWLGFKRSFSAGVGYFVLNSAITETQIWTQPTLARRNYKKYHQKSLENEEGISYLPKVNWYLEAYPGGLGIRVVF